MRVFSTLLILLLLGQASAQCVSFKLTSRRDTINCIDKQGLKQGMWVISVPPLRGEKGYEEEGRFINGQKEGVWRQFSQMGDPIAVENYKWGQKNGISRYYTIAGLEREESWMAVNPSKPYDTIEVQDAIDPTKFEQVVVKNTGSSMRHGNWRYYAPSTGQLILHETWALDQLKVNPPKNAANSTGTVKKMADGSVKTDSTAKIKPKAVLDYEKKNAGKRKSKVRDGRTGG